jgi:hypothetical protein
VEISDIPYAELKHTLKIVVDDFISCRCPIQVFHPHEMLFCFISREYNDLFWTTHLTSEQSLYQDFTKRSRAPGNQYRFIS